MSPKIINIFVFVILTVLSLAIFANSMTKPGGRDEQMYCTGGVLLSQGKMIYRDFSYAAQMPYHPLLYAALFRVLNTTYFLLVGRMVSVFCDILVVFCIISIYRHIFTLFPISGILSGIAASVLYVFNPLVDYANGFAWNHDVVVLLVLLSFRLFQTIDFKQKSKYWRIAVIGALLTLASCMRITTAIVQLLFFVILLSPPADSMKQRFKNLLPFLIASGVFLIWPVWVIASAPRAFFLNLFRIPMLYGEWLHQIGMVHDKFNLILSSITMPGYFVLIVLTIYLWLTVAWQYRKLTISNTRNLILAVLLPLTFFIIALIPPTMWKQYLAIPVPFVIISFAFPLLYLRKLVAEASANKHFNIACVVIAFCVLMTIASHFVVLHRIPELLDPQSWVPIRVHRLSEDIAQRTREPKLILTLAPLSALEGGSQIYTELSCGPIIYRIADYLSPSDRCLTHSIGPETLQQLLEKSPPSAVILGVESEFLEAPLFKSTVQSDNKNWGRKNYSDGTLLYFKH